VSVNDRLTLAIEGSGLLRRLDYAVDILGGGLPFGVP
jgi:hypothetical protein